MLGLFFTTQKYTTHTLLPSLCLSLFVIIFNIYVSYTKQITTTTDPVERDSYIIGDENSTQIVTLGQPTKIRCLAGGYPKPYISWWRHTEMLPLKTARFEVNRDYSLSFDRVELRDLGPYVCQAYSGVGRPASITITLKAVGPVHVRDPEDEQYQQYLVDPAELPSVRQTSTPAPYRPTNQPRPVAPAVGR